MELVGACISLAQSVVSLIQAFHVDTQQIHVSSHQGKGFWEFYSYSSIRTVDVPNDRIEEYVSNRLIPQITSTSALSSDQKEDIANDIDDYVFCEGWEVGDLKTAITQINYRKSLGKLYLYCVSLEANPDHIWGPCTHISQLRTEIDYVLAKDYSLNACAQIGAFTTKVGYEVSYKPAGLTLERISDAIAIAFAPIYLGLIKLPKDFMQIMARSLICNPQSETFQSLSPADQQLLLQFSQKAQQNQQTVSSEAPFLYSQDFIIDSYFFNELKYAYT